MNADVSPTLPVGGDFIIEAENFVKMFSVFFAYVLDSKIIYSENESDRTRFVAPETRDKFALEVSMFVQALLEELVGQEARLRQTVHPFCHFDENHTMFVRFVA